MKKNERTATAIRAIDRDLRAQNLEGAGEADETLAGRLRRVVTVFAVIRPLLVILSTFAPLPTASRSAVTVFVQALDALSILAVPGDTEDVADFKAGRDL